MTVPWLREGEQATAKAKCVRFFYFGERRVGITTDVKLPTAKANAKTQAGPSTRNSQRTRVISLRMTTFAGGLWAWLGRFEAGVEVEALDEHAEDVFEG